MTSPHTRLLSRVEAMIPPLLAQVAPQEELAWALSFQAMPDEGTPPVGTSWVPVLILYVEVPLPEITNSLYSVSLLAPFRLSEEQLRNALTEAVGELTRRRDESFNQQPVSPDGAPGA